MLPILITDDESEDRFFLKKALRKAGVKNPILEFRPESESSGHGVGWTIGRHGWQPCAARDRPNRRPAIFDCQVIEGSTASFVAEIVGDSPNSFFVLSHRDHALWVL